MTATITKLEQELRRFAHLGFTASMKECFNRLPLFTARDESEVLPGYGDTCAPFRYVEMLQDTQRAWAVATNGRLFVAIATESGLKPITHEKLNEWLSRSLHFGDSYEQRAVDFNDFAKSMGAASDDRIVDCTCDDEAMACDDCNGTGKMAWTDQRPAWLKINSSKGEAMVMIDCQLVARCLLTLPLETTLGVAIHADEQTCYFFTLRGIACVCRMREAHVLKGKSPRSIPLIEL